MKCNSLFFSLVLIAISWATYSQTITINANIEPQKIIEGTLNMGNSGPKGKEITINNKYLSFAGQPVIPVMGEIHFSRCNPDKWEDLILKMKANGITIISTYVFWIFHEEEEGVFNWEGQNNLRRFIELCKKHNIWAYPRIGPWCHGEVRNGGLPDWLVKKQDLKIRSNDTAYMNYVKRLYGEISEQLKGLYYKDGGPVIGIQLENEYWRGKGGEYHIMALKNVAQKYGMDVPMYTVTGWRNASVPENEAIPLWGGYPAAPWNTSLKKITTNESYVFSKPINDQSIGNEESTGKYKPNYALYPYFTCELGIGNQISEHRRPILDPMDGVTIATSSVASGSNLPGYYVFAGGLNPTGKFTTLEENKLESGYWNEYPDISYDFQTALRETGETSPAYHKLKSLHYFLSEFGEQLAPMTPIIPEDNNQPTDLQYALRVNKDTGFLFVSNYYRGYTNSTKRDVQFHIQLKQDLIKIPSKPINIEDKTVFVWPVNMPMDNTLLTYATAQPICSLENKNITDWYFYKTDHKESEFLFASKNIKSIYVNKKRITNTTKGFLVKTELTGLENPIIITQTNGEKQRVFVLSEKQKDMFWRFKTPSKTYGFISTANLVMDQDNNVKVFSTNLKDEIVVLNSSLNLKKKTKNGFRYYSLTNNKKDLKYSLKQVDLINEAKWLQASAENYQSKKDMYQKLFFKDFTLKNTAKIKKATCYLFSNLKPTIRVNGDWLNQEFKPHAVNTLDFTGYLQQGENKWLVDFPYSNEDKHFVAVLEVEFYNADKVFISTDNTWLYAEAYKIPAPWEDSRNKKNAIEITTPEQHKNLQFSPHRYLLNVNDIDIANYKDLYVRIAYSGDKIQCYSGQKLVADNFNNDTTWSINLTDIQLEKNKPLVFNIQPFEKEPKIYFDKKIVLDKTQINALKIEPEYSKTFQLKD